MDLTKKQEIFVKEYLDTGNGTQAALEAYDTDNPRVAAAIASENLTKPNIVAYFENVAEKVASNMYHLALNAESEQVQLGAGKDILDRAGYKPVEKSELSNPDGNLKTIIINKYASDNQPTT
jgi:phage terminase small subunit